MKKGDKVIWDSHFGYDIGYFLGKGAAYEHWAIKFASGICCGEQGLVAKTELHPYSKELIAELTEKYGYEKDWSDTF